jgi:hypothetical protein
LVFFSEWARLKCRAFFFAGRSGAVQESQQGLTTIQAKTTENYCPRKRLPIPGNTGIFLAKLDGIVLPTPFTIDSVHLEGCSDHLLRSTRFTPFSDKKTTK